MEKEVCHRAARGLTLVELVVVLALITLLVVLGVPTMKSLRQATRLQAEVQRMMGAIIFTRSEAIRRNVRVSMCPSMMAATGSSLCKGSYANGWIIYQNGDGDKVVDPEDAVIRVYEALPMGYSITNRLGTKPADTILTYKPDGSSGLARTLLFCPPGGGGLPSLAVVLSNVGRPRLARDWGQCPSS